MSKARPSDARRFAVDLIPPTAYWRDPLDVEQKIDFAALEIEEGRLLQGASLRLALIVAGHMEWVLDWIYRPNFGPASLRNPPSEVMADEFGAELTRVFLRSYWEGTESYARWMGRQDAIEGRPPRADDPPVGLTPRAISKMRANANQLAIGITRGIWSRLAPVIESAFAPDGTWTKTRAQIEAEIRSIYGRDYLRKANAKAYAPGDILALSGGFRGDGATVWHFDDKAIKKPVDDIVRPRKRGRPMRIANREAYEVWQRTNVPYSKWIQQAAEVIVTESQEIPELTVNMLSRWVQTERTRYFNSGTVQAAIVDDAVQYLTFSAIRDGSTCSVCRSRDGTTRPKTDFWWAFNQPPMHHGCRCQIVPGTRREAPKVTPQTGLPSQRDVAVGFGTVDREAVQATKRITVPIPRGRQQSKAQSESGYGSPRRKPTPPWRRTVPSNYPGFQLPSEWDTRWR